MNVDLSRKLVLETRESQPDGSGGHAVTWVPLGTLWADVSARTGREDFVAGQVRHRTKYRIVVRGAPTGAPSRPRPDQRLREGARVFNILSVAEADPRGRYLEIHAEEGIKP
jgi:SPP1 family predicted phage head-tail adaptor